MRASFGVIVLLSMLCTGVDVAHAQETVIYRCTDAKGAFLADAGVLLHGGAGGCSASFEGRRIGLTLVGHHD